MSKKLSSTSVLPADTDTAFALRTSTEWVELKAGRLQDGSLVQERTAADGGQVELVLLRDIHGTCRACSDASSRRTGGSRSASRGPRRATAPTA